MRIAVITSRFPYPLERGDKLRIYHQIKHLSEQHEIYLYAVTDTVPHESDLAYLRQYCKKVEFWHLDNLSYFYNMMRRVNTDLPLQCSGLLDERFHQRILADIVTNKLDLVYCQLIRMAPYLDKVNIPVVVDYMDALGVGMKRRANLASWYAKPIYQIEAKRVINYEKEIASKYSALTIISDQDRNLMPIKKDTYIHLVPNGIDASYFTPNSAMPKYDVVFVGNLGYLPNVEAAEILAKEIWPRYRAKYNKSLTILIAGARPSTRVTNLETKYIRISPWREDIRTAYSEGKVMCAPLYNGTGQQNKILEAMSMQIPCITTSQVNKAIFAKNGTEILMADSTEEMVQALNLLLNDDDLHSIIRSNSRKFVINNYTWEKSVSKLNSIFAQILEQSI